MMNNREAMLRDLAALPEWDETGEREVRLSTPTVHLFTPDAGAHWFLIDKDTYNPNNTRYFGLCDLGMGFPELGWVDHVSLVGIRGSLGLEVEVETYVVRTLADGYRRIGEELPTWIPE
jgi:hypothetical protein